MKPDTLEHPRTEDQLDAIRGNAVAMANDTEIVFTCDDCGARYTCAYAFDLYNLFGDCLMEK